MVVLVLVAAPPGLRGHVTRWLVEVAPGVFVGRLSGRARAILWETVAARIGVGQAVLIQSAVNEQRWTVDTTGVDRWVPRAFDGLVLVRRPPGRVADEG